MNIRYGEDILQACQAANLRIGQLSAQDEPGEAKSSGITRALGSG